MYMYALVCPVDTEHVCVCVDYLVVDNEACVRSCGAGRRPHPDTKICEACDGPCPKACPGATTLIVVFELSVSLDQFLMLVL